MYSINQSIINAIEIPSSLRVESRIILQPSTIFIDSFDDEDPPAFADAAGILNDPVPQEIAYITSGSDMCTFFTDDSQLKYMLQGSNEVTIISSISPIGKVGVYGNRLFLMNSAHKLMKYTISWSDILSRSTSPLSSPTEIATITSDVYSTCAVSETEVVVFYYDRGGFKVVCYDDTTQYLNSDRFMFPVFAQSDRIIGRSLSGMITYTTAVKLNNDIFAYISNPLTGTVDATKFSYNTKTWSDIYIAVPTDLDVTQYETRICNSYVRDNVIYISAQLHQIELAETETVISFIISSRDGKIFSYNRYTGVSNLGYRFLANISGSTIRLASCNRIASAEATYVFSPISGSDGYSEDISDRLIIVSDGSQESASMVFSDSDFSLRNHEWMKEGNRILWQLSYYTTNGLEYVNYGCYMIDSISVSVAGDSRNIRLSLINESLFNLSTSNAPYYTEVISKSSVKGDFDDLGDFDTSGSGGLVEGAFCVEFWDAEGYDGFGATPVSMNSRGGLDLFEYAGAHSAGIKTNNLKDILGSSDYPVVSGSDGNVHLKVYGWSHDDRVSGSSNDVVSVALIMINSLGEEYTSGSDGGVHFPNTYPSSAAGDYPIEVDIPVTIGDKIKDIGLVFTCANATQFYPSRVEVTSGIRINYAYKTNTIWELNEGKYKLPDHRKAFVMFAQKPYDAIDFIINAGFENDITGTITGYTAGFGLVGLAMSNADYICGRYDITSNKFQLLKVRNSVETILHEDNPTTTVSSPCELQFEHKAGHFIIRMKIGDDWVQQLDYYWDVVDGYMVTDHLVANKVGVYGRVDTPFFRTSGYDPGSTESEGDNAIGIAVLPGYNTYADFPSTGKIEIKDNIYNYTTKMDQIEIRGPFQFRQYGLYVDPYGDGPGIECRDMDWTRSSTIDNGAMVAIDDGVVFELDHAKWNVWITTDGLVVQLPGRARYYGDAKTASTPHTLYNRVYMTYGLKGITMFKGETDWHSWGTEIRYYIPGEIYCTSFSGSSGKTDATIRDLIEIISSASGALSEFEDNYDAELTTTSGSAGLGFQEYVSGFDVRFAILDNDFGSGDSVSVYSDAAVSNTGTKSMITFINVDGNGLFYIELYSEPDHLLIERYSITTGADYHTFRVLFHDNFATAYIDDRWGYTFCLEEITYANTCNLYLLASEDTTFTDVYMIELSDWSEAFYIDLDTDGMAAINQVIKERPVEIISRTNGAIKYSYNENRDNITIPADRVKLFSETKKIPNNCGSNAIIYSDIVRTLQYSPYLAKYGFATRIFRFPNLTIGSLKAAKLTLKRGMESAEKYTFAYRPDPRIEVGDKLSLNFEVIGTGLSIVKDIVVEKFGINLQDGKYGMGINGRGSL